LALLRKGLPKKIAKLHHQTFTQIQYNFKHKLGISLSSHSHNKPAPVYGVGQGACGAPVRWGFVCDALIKVYKSLGIDAVIISSLSKLITNQKIAAFVDDTVDADDTVLLCILHKQMSHCIQTFLQSDAQLWERLFFTSGGKLEIPKCNFTIIDWYYDNFGRATLENTQHENLKVKCSETNLEMQIPFLPTNKSYKYVGVQIAFDGNPKNQINDLQSKCTKIALVFTRNYLNAKDDEQGFMTVYIPIVKYPLPSTSITETQFCKIHQSVIKSVLSHLGFNLNMPQAIIHAATLYGGVGLIDLYNEQGCAQIHTILSHLQFEQYLHKPLITLMKSYILLTGITTSPFIDTEPIDYINSLWIVSIRTFMHKTNSQINIPSLKTFLLLRQHDQPIIS
jgi:hypothetical protein